MQNEVGALAERLLDCDLGLMGIREDRRQPARWRVSDGFAPKIERKSFMNLVSLSFDLVDL